MSFSAPRRAKDYPGHFLSHYPLKASLVVVITVLVALGLTASSVTVTGTLQRFLIDRVDEQLNAATNGWAHYSGNNLPGSSGGDYNSYPGDAGVTRPPSDFYVLVVDDAVSYEHFNSVNESKPEVRGLEEPSAPVTVPARPGSASSTAWRAASVANDNGTVTIVALPLEDEEHIIARLVLLQVIIGLIVVAALIVASMYLVRRALRPLNEVEITASRIARGELDQRVPEWAPNTEVGRLSQALNRMLAQIQGAFVAVGASEKAARKSEASMRRFIGDASHELRTPLTSVRGYAELYQSGATDDASMVVEKISEEAGRMSLLVEDLLALVRMDEGRPMEKQKVDMLELVLESADSARAGFPGRTIEVKNHSGEVPVVVGDVNRLHQVIGNLLTNALRHGGDDAAVTITLSTKDPEEGAAAGTVDVDVADNGKGIAEKDLPHLFERFYRSDVSRSRASGGSGLGLSIVKGLVEAHGGTISVSSVEGEGTVFTVSLPAQASDPEDAQGRT